MAIFESALAALVLLLVVVEAGREREAIVRAQPGPGVGGRADVAALRFRRLAARYDAMMAADKAAVARPVAARRADYAGTRALAPRRQWVADAGQRPALL